MIEGARFAVGRIFGGDAHWDEGWELEPETDLSQELTPDIESPSPLPTAHQFSPKTESAVEHYTNMIRAAIAEGGKFGDHEISIPWLRMTLAALEGRRIQLDAMWEGVDTPEPEGPLKELFPSD